MCGPSTSRTTSGEWELTICSISTGIVRRERFGGLILCKLVSGSATYISGTEGGSAWAVNANDEIYEWYKGWTSNRWEKRPGTFLVIMQTALWVWTDWFPRCFEGHQCR